MKPDVLMAAPMYPAAVAAVEREFNAHKLWLAKDRQAFIAERAARIRAVTTTGMVGANRALIESLPRLEIIAASTSTAS